MSENGSTLIEVLIASLIMTTGILAMAQVLSLGTVSTTAARRTTIASVLAGQKLEALRDQVWTLPPSTGALRQNTAGCVEHLDADGRSIGTAVTPPPAAVYTRRWSIEPYAVLPNDVRIVQVLVTTHRSRGRADQGNVGRLADEARVVTIKARSAP